MRFTLPSKKSIELFLFQKLVTEEKRTHFCLPLEGIINIQTQES